jgi:xylulokinase
MNFLLSGRATINAYTALRLGSEQTVLPRLGLPVGFFGEAVRIGADLGPLRPKLQARLGWSAIPIIAATFDSKCAYLAAGLDRVGLGLDISGTVTSFGAWSPRPVVDPVLRVYPVPYNDGWLMRGSTAASGSVLEWMRALLDADFATLDGLVSATSTDPDGALLIPYHAGARAPLWQPRARGQMLGLSFDTGRAGIARATYESLGLSLRHVVETIEALGVRVDEIRLAGGLAVNPTLSQVKANILGKQLVALEKTELTTLGLAAIANVVRGRYPDLPAAARQLVRPGRRFIPDPDRRPYDTLFARYVAAAQQQSATSPTAHPVSATLVRPGERGAVIH